MRLLFFDNRVDVRTFRLILNERFLAFLAGILAMYLTAYILWRQRKRMPECGVPVSTFLIGANLFTIWLFSFEIWNHFDSLLAVLRAGKYTGPASVTLLNSQKLSLTVLWALYAVILLGIGLFKRSRSWRLGGLALLAVTIIKVFVFDVFFLERVYRIIAFVGLGLLLLIIGYLYQRYGKAIRSFLVSK